MSRRPALVLAAFVLAFTGCERGPLAPTPPARPPTVSEPHAIVTDAGPSAPSREQVERAIASANHCAQDSECVSIYGLCPLPCSIPVNTAEKARIEELMRAWHDAQPSPC